MSSEARQEFEGLVDKLEALTDARFVHGKYAMDMDARPVWLLGLQDVARAKFDRTPYGPQSYMGGAETVSRHGGHKFPSAKAMFKMNRELEAEPGAWARWQHQAQAGVWNYYGDSGGSNTGEFVMDLESEGMADKARKKIIKDFINTLKEFIRAPKAAHDELFSELTSVLMDPKVSLPSRWLMYYYS
jgi:hypothetical protein